MELELNYEGRRWPSVTVTRIGHWIDDPNVRVSPQYRERFAALPPTFRLSVLGRNKGRAWRPTLAAPWALFAALDLFNPEEVRHFVARYGDPFHRIPGESNTTDWPRLQQRLARALTAWGQANANTVRPILGKRLPHACRFLADPEGFFVPSMFAGIHERGQLGEPAALSVGLVAEPADDGRLILSALNLSAFMVADAHDMLMRQIPLRSCAHCGDPMRLTRTQARFCGPGCRALSSQSHTRKEP